MNQKSSVIQSFKSVPMVLTSDTLRFINAAFVETSHRIVANRVKRIFDTYQSCRSEAVQKTS